MGETFLNIIILFVTFCVYMWVKPRVDVWFHKIISSVRLARRIKKVGIQASEVEGTLGDKEDENIGLSKRGPMFGENRLFNLIGERYPELVDNMKILLIKAGVRHNGAMEEFMTAKFTSGLAIFLMIVLLLGTNDFDIPFYLACLLGVIGGILGGHKLTDLNYEMIASQRKEAIDRGVPDLVDLLVICTESGLDLTKSIRRIAREMRTSNPVLADELSLTSIELEMIPDHRQVFTNLENRTDCLEIKTISKTLSQALEYGSSLSTSLKELAVEAREKRMLEAEGKAAQAPTLLTLPMMFFIMPCLFIVMLGPVIIGMINSFTSK
ncbi:MAG: type II secretion system F family protein [Alphaproteobacteria bacterium]|nr:type II secretion system F family protein [Alphaproteobacteria bacterium]